MPCPKPCQQACDVAKDIYLDQKVLARRPLLVGFFRLVAPLQYAEATKHAMSDWIK